VRKAWLPLQYQVLTEELAQRLGVSGHKGVRITKVLPVREVKDAGFEVGDIIVSYNGDEIPAIQPEDYEVLPAMIRQSKIGSVATFGVLRGGREIKLSMTLQAAPKRSREFGLYKCDSFEFDARDIAFVDRVAEKWSDSQTGVVVENVVQGGWAAIGQLAGGDLLVSVDGREVKNVADLKALMDGIEKNRPVQTVFLVRRGIHWLYLEMKPGWRK
jgi:serine protease Do